MRAYLSLFCVLAVYCQVELSKPSYGDEYKNEAEKELDFLVKDYQPPSEIPKEHNFVTETFQSDSIPWTLLSSKTFSGKWEKGVRHHDWIQGDQGLLMSSPTAYHGLARKLNMEFDPSTSEAVFGTLEVQREKNVNCGGAYFKLFHTSKTEDQKVENFNDKTQYSLMFGPDKCGYMANKVHFIVKYTNPNDPSSTHEAQNELTTTVPDDKLSHQYGFGFYRDGRVLTWFDGQITHDTTADAFFKNSSFHNEKDIDDVTDVKPEDWVDSPMMVDPDAVKPEDWDEDAPEFVMDENAVIPDGWLVDEPLYVANPDATKPSDWDDEEDGEWKPPLMKNPACEVGCGEWTPPTIPNPKYRGKWSAPMIENPDYKGEWSPRKIPNPDYWEVKDIWSVFEAFNAIGFELWTVEAGTMIDNVLVTNNEEVFTKFISETIGYKKPVEEHNRKLIDKATKKMDDEGESEEDEKDSSASASQSLLASIFGGSRGGTLLLTFAVPLLTSVYVLSKWFNRSDKKKATEEDVVEEKKATDEKGGDKKATDEKTPSRSGGEDAGAGDQSAPTSAAGGEQAETHAHKRKGSDDSSTQQ